VTIIFLRKRKYVKETIIMRRRE